MPKHSSILELLSTWPHGPTQVAIIKAGAFDRAAMMEAWGSGNPIETMSFDQAVSAIQKQSDEYARVLSGWTEADFRGEVEMFGRKTRAGHYGEPGAERFTLPTGRSSLLPQSSGREELNTMNLWAG